MANVGAGTDAEKLFRQMAKGLFSTSMIQLYRQDPFCLTAPTGIRHSTIQTISLPSLKPATLEKPTKAVQVQRLSVQISTQ